MKVRPFFASASVGFVVGLVLCFPLPAAAYIGEPPVTLGHMCSWSTHVMIAQIENIDDRKLVIEFRKVRDVKGKWPTDVFRQVFRTELACYKNVFDFAAPGKMVVICALESYRWCHTYMNNEWYTADTVDWQSWNANRNEPQLLKMYAGKTERLAQSVIDILAGREVVVPCLVDGSADDHGEHIARFQRLRASLKLLDYNPQRDFVGFGNGESAPLLGMPGFSRSSTLTNIGTDVHSIISADFEGTGKPGLCMIGANRIALFQNQSDFFSEMSLPGFHGPCISAATADFNGDGKPDLLLATPLGLRLFTNLGQGAFRDDSDRLPREEVHSLTAVTSLDFDGDGRPDILLANGYHGLRLYRNLCPPATAAGIPCSPPTFEDISNPVGLGKDGAAAGLKGRTLTVCDVNGDGRPDFLYGAGTGMLFLHTGKGFELARDSGISCKPGRVGPVFGDFMGDGLPGLFVPQNGACKLYRNDGKGHFADVTAQSGALSQLIAGATCAAWGDVTNSGRLDLVVGCLRGSNRFFRNKGDGTFEDRTEDVGLSRHIYNTQAVCLADLHGRGSLDMIFNNENQDGMVLFGNPQHWNKRVPLSLNVPGPGVGNLVPVLDAAIKGISARGFSR